MPILLGVVAAIFAAIPPALSQAFRAFPWSSPFLVLAVALVATLIQHFVLDARPGPREYDGLADLYVDIHRPSAGNSPVSWALRGIVSLLLAVAGGSVGPEGAA